MKKILLFALIIYSSNVLGQGNVSVNMNLYKKLLNRDQVNSDMYLLVKGNVNSIRDFVEHNNGTFISFAGDIASIKLSLNAIAELVLKPFVKQIGSDRYNYKTMNDTMRMRAFVDQVHSAQLPLTTSYKGSGIVIGMIDSGIDIDHPDFKDISDNTRVKWLWDMNLPNGPNTPQPYGYGREWSGAEIDAGLSTMHTGEDQFGHGTYTTGIAAGNGNAIGQFQGVAPLADLIVVGFNFNALDTVSRMAHAVDYIFTKAQQLGKPCVINASLGDYGGSHDGLDLQAQYISNLLNQQNGRVLVQACGDIGVNYPFHIGRNSVAGDTVFCWIKRNAGSGAAYMEFYADTADLNNVRFSIGADKVTPYYEFRGQTNFTNVFPSLNNLVNQDLYNGPNRIGNIQSYTSLNDGVYHLEVYITPDSTDYYWRFTSTGNGRFDSWNFDYNISPIPADTVFPDVAKYYAPDTLQTIVSSINCLSNVISVANYTNTDRHIDVDTILQIQPLDHPQQIAVNSGRGPTRTGLIKPDLAAPGNHIISTGVLTLIPGIISAGQAWKIAQGGFHLTGGGTSASAPVVAGIAALYLEQNPGAGWMDVKNALTTCAFNDTFMWGPYPNNAWGYGKVNAFEAMTTCSLINSIHGPLSKDNNLQIFPNPANSELKVNAFGFTEGNAVILDFNGRKVFESSFTGENFILPLTTLSEGVYLLQLKSENRIPVVKRFVISL